MSRRSLPAISGAARMAHKLKCDAIFGRRSCRRCPLRACRDRSSVPVRRKSTKARSDPRWRAHHWCNSCHGAHSFLPPSGPECRRSCATDCRRPPCPTATACAVPHSQMLNTIGRPVASSASRIFAYDACASCPVGVAPVVLQIVHAPRRVLMRVLILVAQAAGSLRRRSSCRRRNRCRTSGPCEWT